MLCFVLLSLNSVTFIVPLKQAANIAARTVCRRNERGQKRYVFSRRL